MKHADISDVAPVKRAFNAWFFEGEINFPAQRPHRL